jgi:hypothetical protein
MTVTDLLQVVPTRLIKAVRKLVVNNLLRVQTISDLLEQLFPDLSQQLRTSSANTSVGKM